MEIKEMIRKVYQKNGVQVDDDYIEYKMKDEQNIKAFMRLYKQEEMDSMNYILGKDKDNKVFTKDELELMNTINLFNRKLVEACKIIYEKKYREEKV
jgi:hypothetical protein|nr:MAG TPA: hypothetical protein [Caudoviricetes sp.]